MTSDWSVSRHMTPCKKRYRLEVRAYLLKDWVLLKHIMYQLSVPQMFTFVQDGRQPVCHSSRWRFGGFIRRGWRFQYKNIYI